MSELRSYEPLVPSFGRYTQTGYRDKYRKGRGFSPCPALDPSSAGETDEKHRHNGQTGT